MNQSSKKLRPDEFVKKIAPRSSPGYPCLAKSKLLPSKKVAKNLWLLLQFKTSRPVYFQTQNITFTVKKVAKTSTI
jgi:hypothetical protein